MPFYLKTKVHDRFLTDFYNIHFVIFLVSFIVPAQVYVSEKTGSDTSGKGTESAPFQSVQHALKFLSDADAGTSFMVDGDDGERWKPISKTALKKHLKKHKEDLQKVS